MEIGAHKFRVVALSSTLPVTRSARFRMRMTNPQIFSPIRWETLIALPQWFGGSIAQQNRVGNIAGLLFYRRQVDRELSGARLAALAAMVGEAEFDAVCDAGISDDWPAAEADTALPSPSALVDIGRRMLNHSLPEACRQTDRLDQDKATLYPAENTPQTRYIVEFATDIALKFAPSVDDVSANINTNTNNKNDGSYAQATMTSNSAMNTQSQHAHVNAKL